MKIFLDTANLKNIKYWMQTGLLDGVTTNPTHLSKECQGSSKEGDQEVGKENKDVTKLVKEICAVVAPGDVSVEVTETEPEKVYKQAKEIAALAKNVVVKIPCHENYLETIKKLVQENVPLNITLIFTVSQGLLMCKLGVKYISPFVGRLDDVGVNGAELLTELRVMVDEYKFSQTQIIAASIRDEKRFCDAILSGSDVVTVPAEVLQRATQHKLTDQGIKKFMDDWKKLGVKQFP